VTQRFVSGKIFHRRIAIAAAGVIAGEAVRGASAAGLIDRLRARDGRRVAGASASSVGRVGAGGIGRRAAGVGGRRALIGRVGAGDVAARVGRVEALARRRVAGDRRRARVGERIAAKVVGRLATGRVERVALEVRRVRGGGGRRVLRVVRRVLLIGGVLDAGLGRRVGRVGCVAARRVAAGRRCRVERVVSAGLHHRLRSVRIVDYAL
jgi:hypothetical protein